MKILIDMVHTADVNFYKQAIQELSKEHTIIITILNRGRLPQIIEKEFKDYEQIVFGKHRSSLCGKIITTAQRELKFLHLYLTRKIDVVSSFGYYPSFLAPLFGIKAVNFHDDKEYKLNYELSKRFASRFISICPTKDTKKTRVVNSYKELAYLSLKPDASILKKLGVKKGKYIYIREVASVSLNYKNEEFFNYQDTIDYFHKKGYIILFDGESDEIPYNNIKSIKPKYSTQQMIAINAYAALIITSGDTILREGALLGIPTIYTSSRNMSINQELVRHKLFSTCLNADSLLKTGKKIISQKKQFQHRAKKLRDKCEDITKVIVEEVGTK